MIRHALIALAAATALAAPARAEMTTLRIQDYPGIGNFLVRIANANGLCAKHGIQCERRDIPQAPLGMQTLLAGDIDIAYVPPEVAIQAFNKGADVRAIGSGGRAPVFFLMAGADMPVPNGAKGYPAGMRDFKGKKVGVTARGSAAEFQLVSLLQGAGLKAGDVTIIAVGAPNTGYPAIRQKQVDALMLFTPMDGFCEVTKVCRVVVDPRQGQGPADATNVNGAAMLEVVRTDFLRKNPQAVAAFKAAMEEATAFAQKPENFPALLKIGLDTFKINAPDGDKIMEVALRNSLASIAFPADPKALQSAAQYLQKTGQIDKAVDTSRLLAQ